MSSTIDCTSIFGQADEQNAEGEEGRRKLMSSHSIRVAAWGYLVLRQPHLKVGQDQQPARGWAGVAGTSQKCSRIKKTKGTVAAAGWIEVCLAWQIRRWKFTFLLLLLRAHKIQINDKTTTTRQKPQPRWRHPTRGRQDEEQGVVETTSKGIEKLKKEVQLSRQHLRFIAKTPIWQPKCGRRDRR